MLQGLWLSGKLTNTSQNRKYIHGRLLDIFLWDLYCKGCPWSGRRYFQILCTSLQVVWTSLSLSENEPSKSSEHQVEVFSGFCRSPGDIVAKRNLSHVQKSDTWKKFNFNWSSITFWRPTSFKSDDIKAGGVAVPLLMISVALGEVSSSQGKLWLPDNGSAGNLLSGVRDSEGEGVLTFFEVW